MKENSSKIYVKNHEGDCTCPYCFVRKSNKKKLYFSVNPAQRNTKCPISRPLANAAMLGYPTPLINLRVKKKKKYFNKLATLCALPDTGASIDCIEDKFVKKHNLEILPDTNQMIELVSAEGKMIKVLGTTNLKIQGPGGGWTTTVALVCPQLSHQFLLSWITQKRLQHIHQSWPFTRIMSAKSEHYWRYKSLQRG